MLHITNGDSAAMTLREAGFEPLIAWRDALHDGPVPLGMTLEELSVLRHGDELGERDAAFRAADEIAIWLEHDLYDQLQLLQILASCDVPAWLINPDRYLGRLTVAEFRELWPARQRVNPEQFELARAGWEAFRSGRVEEYLQRDLSVFPHLRAALERWLEEQPSERDGLGRNQRQILLAVSQGARTFGELFGATQQMEEAIYLGDTSFREIVNGLRPLVGEEPYALTEHGRAVLEGRARV